MHSRNAYVVGPALSLILAAACSSEGPNAPAAVGTSRASLTDDKPLPRYATPPRLADGTIAPRRGTTASPSIPTPGAVKDLLAYSGGRVISNVKVIAVNWGPNVNATLKNGIGAFYTAITNSAYFDWLSEYDTFGLNGLDGARGSGQRIGRGTFGGSVTITPSLAATTITNDQIAAELEAQLNAGKLPAPVTDAAGNVNSIYMFDFPPGVTITLGTDSSCTTFGAYHFTIVHAGKSVPYGVHPDCAFSFNTATSIHSHELIEAVTDMEVGLVPDTVATIARPAAWYWYATASRQGEIGDICESGGNPDVVVAGYTVQKQWSNSQGACIGTSPTIICNGSTPAIPGCRACTAADDGAACNGARPVCETKAGNHKFGQCVACTTTAACAGGATCIQSNDDTDDSCATAGCTTNAQCSVTSPICDTVAHTCRECNSNADCSPGVCAAPGTPKHGQCVECVANADCKAPKQCDTSANVCIAPPPPGPDASTPPTGDAGTPAEDSGASTGPVGGGSSGGSGSNPPPVVAADAGNSATPDGNGGTAGSSGCSASKTRPGSASFGVFAALGLALLALRRRTRR